MILLVALAAGLLAGWLWARWHQAAYTPPQLRSLWLVPIGFLPQLLVAYVPASRAAVRLDLGAVSLAISMIVFLAFIWMNRRLAGMPLMLAGLLLNLAVMLANGGWMPISPENATRIVGEAAMSQAVPGDRIGPKDVLMRPSEMRLGLLADRFMLPRGSPYQVAFSAGDILIAAGAFWLMASPPPKTISSNTE